MKNIQTFRKSFNKSYNLTFSREIFAWSTRTSFSLFRQQFWIIDRRSVIRKIVRTCCRHRSQFCFPDGVILAFSAFVDLSSNLTAICNGASNGRQSLLQTERHMDELFGIRTQAPQLGRQMC